MIFAIILDPDLALQNIGPDLDPICLTFRIDFEKKHKNFPEGKELSLDSLGYGTKHKSRICVE